MPTDNPKISLYVPQQIYDRFKSFQEERKLSMSQAGIVVLAEYFGLEETIKEVTEGTTIGGVTLAEFKKLQERFEILENQVNLNRKILDPERIFDQVEEEESASSLLNEEQKKTKPPGFKPIPASHLSKKRFGLGKDTLASYKRKHTLEELAIWTKEKDPDGITWVLSSDKKGYIPLEELPSELYSKLQKWVELNL